VQHCSAGPIFYIFTFLAFVSHNRPRTNGLCRTESRAWPGQPILIPRGGPRPWGSYQRWTAERHANQHFRWSRDTVSATGWGESLGLGSGFGSGPTHEGSPELSWRGYSEAANRSAIP